jgi:hypothetical protein
VADTTLAAVLAVGNLVGGQKIESAALGVSLGAFIQLQDATSDGAAIIIGGGESDSANGGSVTITGGFAGGIGGEVTASGATTTDGGDVLLTPGGTLAGGRTGLVIIDKLQTTDPGVLNAVWLDPATRVLKVSAG